MAEEVAGLIAAVASVIFQQPVRRLDFLPHRVQAGGVDGSGTMPPASGPTLGRKLPPLDAMSMRWHGACWKSAPGLNDADYGFSFFFAGGR